MYVGREHIIPRHSCPDDSERVTSRKQFSHPSDTKPFDMRFSRSSLLLSATSISVATTVSRAFSLGYAGRKVGAFSSSSAIISNRIQHPFFSRFSGSGSGSSTGLSMIFDKIIRDLSIGGAFESRIDYENLDFPGDELGKLAEKGLVPATSPSKPELMLATFAGGCFWGLELAYQRIPGVVHTAVGYTQGPSGREPSFPNYDQVCSGSTGHTEAVLVYYNPKECTYEQLLDTFFNRVDPLQKNGQGSDRGTQYRTGVYFHSPEQEKIAKERFESEQTKYSRPIASECLPAQPFWPAEQYHQQYLEKGGRFNSPQDASKGATDPIRCYG